MKSIISIPKNSEKVIKSDMITTDDNNFFEYVSIGLFRSQSGWIHPTRIIDSYEMIFVTEGTVYIKETDTEYEVSKNECLLLEPNKVHGGYKVGQGSTSFYWFHFKTDMQIPFKLCNNPDYYDTKYLTKKLLHMSNTPLYPKSALDTCGLMIFSELQKSAFETIGNPIANKIAEYIRINTVNVLTVKNIAKYFGYNSDYMNKIFKKTFGTGIKNYICTERIKLAKDLLLNTELSVKEISAQMNFADENRFIKFFKYNEEISPTQFRNKYFNIHMNNK